MVRMRFARVRYEDPQAAPLIADLRREYEERYGESDAADDVAAHEFDPPAGIFVLLLDDSAAALALNDGRPVTVAGGGIRHYDAVTCEIKRMWTNSDYRRQGHAVTVLAELESIARELGYQRLLLETGPAQPEALALYRRLGFRETGPYGRYPHAYGFERMLGADT
jgi:GNAT superfamily N-acetyltransferase